MTLKRYVQHRLKMPLGTYDHTRRELNVPELSRLALFGELGLINDPQLNFLKFPELAQ